MKCSGGLDHLSASPNPKDNSDLIDGPIQAWNAHPHLPLRFWIGCGHVRLFQFVAWVAHLLWQLSGKGPSFGSLELSISLAWHSITGSAHLGVSVCGVALFGVCCKGKRKGSKRKPKVHQRGMNRTQKINMVNLLGTCFHRCVGGGGTVLVPIQMKGAAKSTYPAIPRVVKLPFLFGTFCRGETKKTPKENEMEPEKQHLRTKGTPKENEKEPKNI